MSVSHGVNKMTPCVPLSNFHLFCLLFYNNLLFSNQIVAEDYEFPKGKQICSFNSWLVDFDFAVYFCLYVLLRRF